MNAPFNIPTQNSTIIISATGIIIVVDSATVAADLTRDQMVTIRDTISELLGDEDLGDGDEEFEAASAEAASEDDQLKWAGRNKPGGFQV